MPNFYISRRPFSNVQYVTNLSLNIYIYIYFCSKTWGYYSIHILNIYKGVDFPLGYLETRPYSLVKKKFKEKRSALQGKPEPKSLTKVTIQTAYYQFFFPSITTKTYRNRNIHTKHKQELGRLHQTIISFTRTEVIHLIHLLHTFFFLL